MFGDVLRAVVNMTYFKIEPRHVMAWRVVTPGADSPRTLHVMPRSHARCSSGTLPERLCCCCVSRCSTYSSPACRFLTFVLYFLCFNVYVLSSFCQSPSILLWLSSIFFTSHFTNYYLHCIHLLCSNDFSDTILFHFFSPTPIFSSMFPSIVGDLVSFLSP